MTTTPARAQDPLLTPFRLKSLTLRNRVMSTSHSSGLNDAGMPGERYQAYHEAKAKGGLALTMFGGSSNVSIDSPSVFNQLNVGTDAVIPYLAAFAERIHAHDTALMCQITHLGRRGDPWAGEWLPTIGPSPVRERLHRSFPKAMERGDIERVVRDFGEAAWRCKEGGLDGIETLAGGHLIGQFMSPLTNRRTDEFGGSPENRARFAIMVHEEIRRRVGDDFVVGIRMSIDDGEEGGTHLPDAIAMARALEAAGTIDFFNIVWGGMDTARALAEENMPAMHVRAAPWLEPVGRFRSEVTLPVFHAAKISDVATARHAIREGILDMVGMTRAHIADPQLVTKIMRGEEELIRPCVGASHCMGAKRPKCLHNAATGRESVFSHDVPRARETRRVTVVGGGPAGLEAARVSALRGHTVVLHEAAGQLGGQVILAARHPLRRELTGLVDWRVAELERLGVEVRLDSFVEADDIDTADTDVVIVATGGQPGSGGVAGADLAMTTWDIVGGANVSGSVLIHDGTGRQGAPLAALTARAQGCEVTLVTVDGEICADVPFADRVLFKRKLYEAGVVIVPDLSLVALARADNRIEAHLVNEADRGSRTFLADVVVLEEGTLPFDEAYHGLAARAVNAGLTDPVALVSAAAQPHGPGFSVHRIGDATASRNIASAITDAYRLCYAL